MRTTVIDRPEVGVGVVMDREPDRETAVANSMVETALSSVAQTERTVDIMEVGRSILTRRPVGSLDVRLNELTLSRVGDEIAHNDGDIALVTPTTVIDGRDARALRMRRSEDIEMPELEWQARIGRHSIEEAWFKALPGRETDSLALTTPDLDDEVLREANLEVISALFDYGKVPIITEDDVNTHAGVTFGSEDILAARLAARMQESDLFGTVRLFLLTNVNGVYERMIESPLGHRTFEGQISIIEDTDECRRMAHDTNNEDAVGGMVSKFDAADIAKAAGVGTWIYNPLDGSRQDAVDGNIGTHFPATPANR